MEEVEFSLRGKIVRMARQMKDVKPSVLANLAGIDTEYLMKMEREVRSISRLNEIRLIRALRGIGVTDAQLVALQLIIEHEEKEL